MDEHTALVDQGYGVRQALGNDDPLVAMTLLTPLISHLQRHVQREEDGILQALRDSGEFLDEVDALETEHDDFEKAIVRARPRCARLPGGGVGPARRPRIPHRP
jgi:hypothetical protein